MAEKSAPAPTDTPAAEQLSAGAPAPRTAGSEPDGGAAPASSTPPAEPRGRGKRGPDKRPRVRRGSEPKPKEPDSPLHGSVDGDDAGRRGHVGPKDKRPKGTASAAELLAMSSEELAAIAVGVGNAVIVRVASFRYGDAAAKAHISLDQGEAEQVCKLTQAYLDTVLLKMTPGEALAWSLVLLYGSKAAAFEMGAHKKGAPTTDDAYPPDPPRDDADRARDVTPKAAA